MSINIPPPEFSFPSLQYNPEFWVASSSGTLTQSVANTLYLRKTTTDSASALETFNGGILTSALDSTVTTLDIFNAVTGRLGIAVNNTGSATPIKIGQTSSSVHCSGIDLQGTTIHGLVHASSDLSIGNEQTSGILHIGDNAARTAAFYLGAGSSGITLGTFLLPISTIFSNVGQIGYSTTMSTGAFNGTLSVAPAVGNIATYLTTNRVPAGLWLFEMTCTLSAVSVDTIFSFSTTSATHDVTRAVSFSPTSVATVYYARLTTIMSFGALTNFYLVGSANAAQTVAGLTVYRTRIA